MNCVRKTRDEFDIEGNYGQGFEIVCCEPTLSEARDRIIEHRENEPGIAFRIRHHRVKENGNNAGFRTEEEYQLKNR